MPWKITVGHLTCLEASKLLKRSSRRRSTILPYFYLATSMTDLIGLTSTKASAFLKVFAKWQAGPEPMDLPLMIMFDSFTKQVSLRNSNTQTASSRICLALCC